MSQAEQIVNAKRLKDSQHNNNDSTIDELHRPQTKTNRQQNNIQQQISCRLPQVRFAALLEKVLIAEGWKHPQAEIFRLPVDRSVVGYYEKISNPICLMDIRQKIGMSG